MSQTQQEFSFDRVTVHPGPRQLFVDGHLAKIGSRAFDMLLALVARRERVVAKNELLNLVWPGVNVEEGNLQVQMVALRKLLGPNAIATIPGRGYKFAAELAGRETAPPIPSPNGPPAAAAIFSGNLPASLPPLYGRESDVGMLTTLLAQHRMVSIVGPGGIGKTRTAQAVAHEMRQAQPDGAWLVELAPLDNPALAASTVARALGLALGPDERPLESLAAAMAGQNLLLVLDNCEHIAAAMSELAGAILAKAPGVRLLITSQEPLHHVAEQVYRLRPLTIPATVDADTALRYGAVALFAARARAADARFALNEENVADIVEICSRLDGIALAIELAAARVSLLGVRTLRLRLRESLRLLAGGARDTQPRHRTLRAALEWSYALLTPDERKVLDRLGVFVGGFTLEAAQTAAADADLDEWSVLDCLAGLVEKSLVMVDMAEPPRYRLLQTTRAFALERLAETGATLKMRRAHALAIIAVLRGTSLAESPGARMRRTAPELDNLLAAAQWASDAGGDRAIAIELVGEAGFLWSVEGGINEGARLLRKVEPWIDASTPASAAAPFWMTRCLLWMGMSARYGAQAGQKAAALYRELGDAKGEFLALIFATAQSIMVGDQNASKRRLAEAKSLIKPEWPRWMQAVTDVYAALNDYFFDRPEEWRNQLRRARDVLQWPEGDAYFAELAELNLILVDYVLESYREVAAAAEAILSRPRTQPVGFVRTYMMFFRAAALLALGEIDSAEAIFRLAVPQIKRAIGTARWTLSYLALLTALRGRGADAARLIGFIDEKVDAMRGFGGVLQSSTYAKTLDVVRAEIDVDRLAHLRSEGAALTTQQAIALALPESDAPSQGSA